MKKTEIQKIFLVAIIIFGIIPVVLFAQTDTTTNQVPDGPTPSDVQRASLLFQKASVNADDIDVITTPEFPGAFETVSIRLDSNSIDLNRYTIQWTTDTFEQKSGLGLRDFTTTSGAYGSQKHITATILGSGSPIRKNIIIAPQDATVLWEAIDSYVPPFYRGKKLPGQESLIRIAVLPNFKSNNNSLKINDAVYLWTRNNNKILNIGGYAKDSIVIQHNKLRTSEKIKSTVSSVSGDIKVEKTIEIPIYNPEIHWYVRNKFNYRRLQSIDNGLRVASGDTNLIAEPYFFSITNSINDLEFNWSINGESIYLDPNAPSQELLVRNPGTTGQANFQVSITNPKTFLQSAGRADIFLSSRIIIKLKPLSISGFMLVLL
jgi:hypothetical protein